MNDKESRLVVPDAVMLTKGDIDSLVNKLLSEKSKHREVGADSNYGLSRCWEFTVLNITCVLCLSRHVQEGLRLLSNYLELSGGAAVSSILDEETQNLQDGDSISGRKQGISPQ